MTDRIGSRRQFLRAAGVTGAVVLAGCTADGGDGGDGSAPTHTPGNGLEPLGLRTVATGFDAPVDFAHAPGLDRRYVADQTGTVHVLTADGHEPFLDIGDQIETRHGEEGLLGLALHPEFEENRRFYVRYSAPRRADTPDAFHHTFVLAEFEAAEDGRTADPATERTVLEIPQPQGNHNAGSIAFGPDSYLYVGVGDGGAANDVGRGHVEGGNGQDVVDNLLGSMLRIDVDTTGADRAYGIPEDNPLVGEEGLEEHYAWGLRNPWRFSFDGEDLYVGDVGQRSYEEVDIVEHGGNYGWNVWEGTHCFGGETCPVDTPDSEPFTGPIIEYPHGDAPVSGVSVIGGYVYRGGEIPGLAGRYLFGDLAVSGRFFVADRVEGDGLWPTWTAPIGAADQSKLGQLLSFGRDAEDRLYALGRGDSTGGVYEIVASA